jgi:hypothetical protein
MNYVRHRPRFRCIGLPTVDEETSEHRQTGIFWVTPFLHYGVWTLELRPSHQHISDSFCCGRYSSYETLTLYKLSRLSSSDWNCCFVFDMCFTCPPVNRDVVILMWGMRHLDQRNLVVPRKSGCLAAMLPVCNEEVGC